MNGKRLKELRKEKGITQARLAEKLNVDTSLIGKWEIYDITPSIETLKKLANILNTSVSDLLGVDNNIIPATLDHSVTRIPIYGVIPAGTPIEAVEDIIDYEEIPKRLANSGMFFGLKVKGNSMYPEIKNGDIVILKQQEDANTGDICAVMINGFDATLKKIKKENDCLNLIPINPEYEIKTYTAKQCMELPVKILGKVIEVRRTF